MNITFTNQINEFEKELHEENPRCGFQPLDISKMNKFIFI